MIKTHIFNNDEEFQFFQTNNPTVKIHTVVPIKTTDFTSGSIDGSQQHDQYSLTSLSTTTSNTITYGLFVTTVDET